VHPSMEYKLLPRYRGRFDVEPTFVAPTIELVPMPIVEIRPRLKKYRHKRYIIRGIKKLEKFVNRED